MKNCFAVLSAMAMAVTLFSAAGASSPMDSIVWQTYDNFSEQSLNTSLWSIDKMNGTYSANNGELTLAPTTLSGGGKNKVSIKANLVINNGTFLAVQVPFSIASAGAPASGGAESFQIELDDKGNNYGNIIWGIANNFSSDGAVYNGTLFNSSSDVNQAGTTQNTAVTAGQIGFIYSEKTVTMYYNNGTGWQQLGAATSTVGWAFPLSFTLRATINNSGSLTVVVPNVQYSYTTPVALSLSSGWNLVALPLQPPNSAITSVLSGIAGTYEVVWAYPNQKWQVYDPNDAGGSTLATMQTGMGYWIKMTSAKTLSVSGSVPSSSPLSLSSGWNLVGYNGTSCTTDPTDLTAALFSIYQNLQVLWGYPSPSKGWQFYDPGNSGTNTLTQLCQGGATGSTSTGHRSGRYLLRRHIRIASSPVPGCFRQAGTRISMS